MRSDSNANCHVWVPGRQREPIGRPGIGRQKLRLSVGHTPQRVARRCQEKTTRRGQRLAIERCQDNGREAATAGG